MNGPQSASDPSESAAARFAATRHADGDWSAPRAEDLPELERAAALWRALDSVAEDPALKALRSEALARAEEREQAARPRPRWRTGGALAASLAAALAAGAAWWLHPSGTGAPPMRLVSNGHAAPRHLALADGSRLTLDADTSVRVEAGGRKVVLDAGRAYFSVRHDAAHPFTVTVGDSVITDVGTSFEVATESGRTLVTLVEGEVAVAEGEAAPIRLTPGMRLALSGGNAMISHLDTARATQWQSGTITADNETVAAVLTRFNRYRAQPLAVPGGVAGQVRISGVFRLDDPEGLMRAIDAVETER